MFYFLVLEINQRAIFGLPVVQIQPAAHVLFITALGWRISIHKIRSSLGLSAASIQS